MKRNATRRIHQPAPRDKAALWAIIETGKHSDGRQVKQFEAYHAAEILKEIDPDGVREYMKRTTRRNPRDKDGVLRLGGKMVTVPMNQQSRGLVPDTYAYRINLDERGDFNADVIEEDGHELWNIQVEDGEIGEVRDGWMKHGRDLKGLTEYLVHMGVIADGSRIVGLQEAERLWHRNPQRRTRHNPSQHFIVGVTYETYTQESIENGDAEDRGWESEKEPMELRDALAVLNRYGPYDSIDDRGESFIAYHADVQEDYRTGEQTAYDVVVEGSAANLKRLLAAYDKKWKRNGKRTRKNPHPMFQDLKDAEYDENEYGWIVTRDHLDDKDVEIIGPRQCSKAMIAQLRKGKGQAFRMKDDDGILYYSGRYIGPDDEWMFSPLSDFGEPNAGAVIIEYRDKRGWRAL